MKVRTPKICTVLAASCIALAGFIASAEASPIPAFSVEVGPEGNAVVLNPQGEDYGDGTFGFHGEMTANPAWDLEWDVTVDPDPFISAVMGFTNTMGTTQTFVLNVVLPIFPPVTPSSVIGGSIALTLTDANGDGSALLTSDSPTPIYYGTIDGSPVLPLFSDPYSLSVGIAGGSTNDNTSAGLPGPTIPGPAALTEIGISHTFTLSPGDKATLVSVFVVEAVPEPGTLALTGLLVVGLAMGGRRRRR